MKRIDDLGISPRPWSSECGISAYRVRSSDNECVTVICSRHARRDSRLISAAPELYDALREAVIGMCHDCPNCSGYPNYGCKDKACECFPAKWREALAKAAGEEEQECK